MYRNSKLKFAEIELLRGELFSIRIQSRVTIEEDMAKDLVAACNALLGDGDGECGLILDMSEVAFVTEDARNLIASSDAHQGRPKGLALVSNNHLGNVISTLMMSYAQPDSINMQLFKNFPDAEKWLNTKLGSVKNQLTH